MKAFSFPESVYSQGLLCLPVLSWRRAKSAAFPAVLGPKSPVHFFSMFEVFWFWQGILKALPKQYDCKVYILPRCVKRVSYPKLSALPVLT